MRTNKLATAVACAIAGMLSSASPALAHLLPYVSLGPFVIPMAGPAIPGPANVPGKEYTDLPDKDTLGAADPLQTLHWNGAGVTADSFDFKGTFTSGGVSISDPGREVDGQAHPTDALFDEVVADLSALLVSVTGDPIVPIHSHARITGAVAVWATAPMVDHHGVEDLNSLEVWGPEGSDDGFRFSLLGDPGGTAVWDFDGIGTSTPLISTAAIAGAIGCTGLEVDLDAMMMGGPRIMFSILPIASPVPGCTFDGGEIWVWDWVAAVPGTATFLVQGGVTWDTAHCVECKFGDENVDALEAVSTIPEPGSLALLGLGALGLLGMRRRRPQ